MIYGLYQGHIGSPNIRKTAFRGKTVYDDLAENASIFINANRGTAIKNEKTFRVSSFYERNKSFFPNFEADLTAHLAQYLKGNELAALNNAAAIDADIDDWTVTDLGGSRREVAGSLANNSAAMQGAVSGGASSNYGGTASSGGSGGVNAALARQMRERQKEEEEKESEENPDETG